MKLSAADERNYKKLYYYMKNNLPDVIKVPRIVKALKKNGEIKKNDLRLVLTYGTNPLVK